MDFVFYGFTLHTSFQILTKPLEASGWTNHTRQAIITPMPFPSKKTPSLCDAILARLSKGEPLAQICRDEGMPSSNTFRDWCAADEALGIACARAREEGFDAIAAECLEIAEDGSHDYKTKKRKDGEEYEEFDSEHVQRSKLRIDTRLKLLAKWDPKRYGDKITQEVTGAEGGPLQVAWLKPE